MTQLLGSLIRQLSTKSLPAAVKELYDKHDRGGRDAPPEEFENTLKKVLLSLKESRVYFILDALDECDERAELMAMLKRMWDWDTPNLNTLVSSRKEHDIENCLSSIATKCVNLESALVDKDIRLFVDRRLSGNDERDTKLRQWSSKNLLLKQQIEETISGKANGM